MRIIKRDDRGITVLELMISLGLITLLICLGVPGFKAFFQKTYETNALRTVTAAINSARYQVEERNRRVKMTLEQNKFYLKENRQGDWIAIMEFDPGEEVEITMNTSPVFYPEGYIVPLCSIYIKTGDRDYKVTISLAGRIKVAAP